MIKTRFAPSPTGYLHVGGARTALYNWLFARQNNGVFVLRIEDTDTARSTQESANQILESMAYLGLDYDEPPIFQSDRLKIYQSYAKQLLSEDKAYEKEGAIYFKAQSDKDIAFQDLIIGRVNTPAKELRDFVIMKSDGWPVYHFAVVIDDALMEITHVIRGMDHISNTSKHIQLFQALDFSIPQFAHIPMILGPDKQRLSKRHGAQGVDGYEKEGIIKEGLINFLARLGWGYENQEVFTQTDLLEKFQLTSVSKNSAVFDTHKLIWLNSQHIRQLPVSALIQKLNTFFKKDYSPYEKEIGILRARCQTLLDVEKQLNSLLHPPTAFDPNGVAKYITDPIVFERLLNLKDEIAQLSEFTAATLEVCLRTVADRLQVKAADLIHPSRLALTGVTVGPGLFELMVLLGKESVVNRLSQFQSAIEGSLK